MIKKQFHCIKKREVGIFLGFFLLFYVLHYFMRLISDDVHQKEIYVFDTIFQRISWIYSKGAGKILTDSFGGFLTTIPFSLWKLFDTLLWCCMIWLFTSIFFPTHQGIKRKQFYLLTGILLLCYPYRYLASAGYIMTSSNYIYPTFCILVCIYFILRPPFQGEKTIFVLIPATFFAAYAGSQEQSACVLLGLLLGVLALKLYRKEAFSKLLFAAEFLACTVVFTIVLTSPGLNNRVSVPTRFHVPNYETWSFFT